MEILIKFQLDNTWYFVERDKETVKYYKLENGKKNYDLSLEELDNIKYIIDSLTPNGKKIKLMDYIHKKTTYEILLDTKTNLRLFNPIPNYEDFKELFYLFNNRSETFAFSKKEKKVINDVKPHPHETLTETFIQVGKALVCVFVSAALFSGSLISNYKLNEMNRNFVASQREKDRIIELQKAYFDSYKDYIVGVSNSRQIDDQRAIRMIHLSVDENRNLTEREKELIKEAISPLYIMVNRDYINLTYIGNKLDSLQIKYVSDYPEGKKTTGAYDSTNNIITFFGVENADEVNITVFNHEVYHSVKYYTALGNNFYLNETTNTIINEEFNDYNEASSYTQIYGFTKALMEIIGPEVFKEYSFFESTDEIVDRLARHYGTSDDAKVLLSQLELYSVLAFKPIKNEKEKEEVRVNLNNLRKEIVARINLYYRAAMGMDYTDDLLMLFYLDIDEFSRIIKEKHNIPEELHAIYVTKLPTYINSYKPGLIFHYPGYPDMEINNENRYLNENAMSI